MRRRIRRLVAQSDRDLVHVKARRGHVAFVNIWREIDSLNCPMAKRRLKGLTNASHLRRSFFCASPNI
eukprot:1173602-Prorocentrum_minimum.AAC.1